MRRFQSWDFRKKSILQVFPKARIMRDGKSNVFIKVKHHYFAPIYVLFSNELIQGFELARACCKDDICGTIFFNLFANKFPSSNSGGFSKLRGTLINFNIHFIISMIYAFTFVVTPPFLREMSISSPCFSHEPQVKSGISIEFDLLETDHSLNGPMQVYTAASYTLISSGRPFLRQSISRQFN